MSIGYTYSENEAMIEKALINTMKSLNRPDILIEESKASTQSFQDFVRKRKKTGEDKSIDLFDPLSQSNANLRKIDDLDDIVVPAQEEDINNANDRYRQFYR